MLHILLLILKVIGIILAAILGLLVLLLCIVLFTPLKYQGSGACQGKFDTLEGKIKFSWFFHLVSGYAIYKNQVLDWQVRIAFKKLNGAEDDVAWKAEKEVKKAGDAVGDEIREKVDYDTDYAGPEILDKEAESIPEILSDASENVTVEAMEIKELAEDIADEAKEDERLRDKIEAIWLKIKAIFGKIKYTIKQICDKIKLLLEKKDKLVEFLTDEVHQKAFGRAKREVFRLLRYLKPKKLKLEATFGFEDPCTTGQVLAGYSMLYPFIGHNAIVTPDFERRILEGSVFVKGHIRAVYFAIILWNLVWSKEVRKTYKDIRAFKL